MSSNSLHIRLNYVHFRNLIIFGHELKLFMVQGRTQVSKHSTKPIHCTVSEHGQAHVLEGKCFASCLYKGAECGIIPDDSAIGDELALRGGGGSLCNSRI